MCKLTLRMIQLTGFRVRSREDSNEDIEIILHWPPSIGMNPRDIAVCWRAFPINDGARLNATDQILHQEALGDDEPGAPDFLARRSVARTDDPGGAGKAAMVSTPALALVDLRGLYADPVDLSVPSPASIFGQGSAP